MSPPTPEPSVTVGLMATGVDATFPAKESESARAKKATHRTDYGLPVHGLEILIAELAMRARAAYKLESAGS